MKYIFLMLLSLSFASCASHEKREPSSEKADVSRGIRTDSYGGGPFFR